MLFNRDIERLYDDGFDGSNEERQIFMEVFYGSSAGNATNSCHITGDTNFEVEANRPINALVCSNSENSVLTAQSSIKDLHVEGSCAISDDIEHVKRNHVEISRGVTGSGWAQECSNVNLGRDEHRIAVKRMRCSGDELSNPSDKCSNDQLLRAERDLIQLNSGIDVVRGMLTPDSYNNDPTITCHLVETSSQGIIRSCYLYKQHREVDNRVHLDDGEASNHQPLSLIGKNANEVSDGTAIVSPVSQHIISPEDLVGDAFDDHKSEHLLVPLERSQEPLPDNSDIINISPKRNFLKDLNLRLRSHINNLLIATGWCLEKQKKYCRNYFDTVYISPAGKIFRQFHSVWRACGESLFVGRYKMMREENVKQWVGISDYSSDLSDTLSYIEKDMQPTEPSFALAHLWSVLDPYATAVFIGKQIGAIRKGKPVNVHRTLVVDLSKGKDIVASTNVGGVRDQLMGIPLIAGSTEVVNGNEHRLNEQCRKGSFSGFGEQRQEGAVKALQSVSPHKKDENTECLDSYIVDASVNPGVQREEFRDQSGSLSCSLVPIQKPDLPGIVANTCLYDVPVLLETADTVPRNMLPQHGNDASVSSFCEQTTGSVESVEDGKHGDTQSEGESMTRTMNQLQVSLQDQLHISNDIPVPVGRTTSIPRHFDTCMHCNSLVAEAVQTMVKAIENACNQKGGTEIFSAHCQQSCRSHLKVQPNSGESKRPDGEAASFTPNRFHDKTLNSMEGNYSEYEPNNLLVSSGEEDVIITAVQSKSEDFKRNLSSYMDETIQCNKETRAVAMLKEEVSGRAQEILSPSKRCGELVIRSQSFEKSVTDQQKHVLYPQEQVLHEMTDLSEAELAQGSMLEIDKDVSLHHDMQSSACLRRPTKNCLCSDVDCMMTGNRDSALYEVKSLPELQFSSKKLEPSGHLEDEGSRDSEVSNLEMERASAMVEKSLMKKSQKKSKKISEIKVTKLYSKCSKLALSTPPRVDPRNCQEGKTRRQSRKVQMFCEGNVSKNECHESSLSASSSQHQITNGSRFKNSKHQDSGSEQLAVVSDDAKYPVKPNFVNHTDETLVHANSGFVNSATCRKNTKSRNGRKRLQECQIDDDDLLIAAIIINKEFSSNSKQPPLKPRKSKALRKLKSQKGSYSLLPRNPGKGGKLYKDGKWSSTGARTVLSWLVDVGVIPLNDVIQFRSLKDDTVIKDGWVTKDGILCKCCSKVLSVSEFKVHAGFKLYKPCLNLFLESGKSYTLCLLQAWSAEYKTRKGGKQAVPVDEVDQNDDTCGLCGDGGELICCDNCPSTFHQTCLSAQELPEGSWYCPNCTCEVCGDVVTDKEASSSLAVLKCTQCDHKYHGACIKDNHNCKVISDKWFCGAMCQEIYTGFRSRVGNVNLIDDGFSWTLLRCIHGDQKVRSAQRFALMAECNSKLAVALTIMEECFLSMVDPRTGINMIPQVIYNWGSNFARLNFQGFYTAILEKEDEIISVATIRVHGLVAEMPLVATRTEHRRQGMCRQLINAVEEFLTSLKVERLIVAAIPSLVDTWTFGFGFEPVEDKEREQLNSINLMVFPGTTLLTKNLYYREATEIQDGPGDASTTGREGLTKGSVCVDQKVIQEAGPDMPALLDLKKMQLEEEGSSGKKHISASFELPVSNFGRNEQEIVSNVERCCPRIVTSGMYDGSRRLSTEH